MKHIFLTASILFGITGICQAMDVWYSPAREALPMVFDWEFISISFQPLPGFLRVLLISFGFFAMYLIWKKLRTLGLKNLAAYMPS